EWQPFVETFTKACDRIIDRDLEDKLEPILPNQVVKDLRQFIDSDISTQKAANAVFQHLETIIFELHADYDDDDIDENLQDITDILQGREKDLEFDFDGVLAFIVDVNPREALSFLKYFRANTDYKFIRNNTPNGDFILKFDFEHQNRDIEFCCAGVKIDAGRYAVIFADDDRIAQYCQSFKTGRFARLNTKQPKKEFIAKENYFRFIAKQLRLANMNSTKTDFFDKIKNVKAVIHDTNGISQFDLVVTMRTNADAVAVRDLFVGLLAFPKLMSTDKSSELNVLKSIKCDAAGTNVSVQIKLDDPEIWKLISRGLQLATEKIEQRQ
ncbi:MAG: hypothetical protein LBH59_00975, partial [Planctomycetaceae bacterium]|nr:hypothetical protein [Planctomycetaceae bacterium]